MSSFEFMTHPVTVNARNMRFHLDTQKTTYNHVSLVFSHAFYVATQDGRENAIFLRGISEGHQGASRGIRGHQLPIS